jgi:hypothetical protein
MTSRRSARRTNAFGVTRNIALVNSPNGASFLDEPPCIDGCRHKNQTPLWSQTALVRPTSPLGMPDWTLQSVARGVKEDPTPITQVLRRIRGGGSKGKGGPHCSSEATAISRHGLQRSISDIKSKPEMRPMLGQDFDLLTARSRLEDDVLAFRRIEGRSYVRSRRWRMNPAGFLDPAVLPPLPDALKTGPSADRVLSSKRPPARAGHLEHFSPVVLSLRQQEDFDD